MKTCLIAEHDPWEINLLSVFAERFGFQVSQAYQGQDIVSLVNAVRPDVIILEQDLPGNLTPADVLQHLTTQQETSDIPVIITYSTNFLSSHESLKRAACFLRKPATYDDFVKAMSDAGL